MSFFFRFCVVVVVFVVVDDLDLFIFFFYPRHLPLQFGQNRVSNGWNVAFAAVVIVHNVVAIVVVDLTNLSLKFGENRVRKSCDIEDIEFVVVGGGGGGGVKSFSCQN